MSTSFDPTSGDTSSELFPLAWLTAQPQQVLINTAPTGVAVLRALRDQRGQIIDFQYVLVNPMQQALIKHPQEDLLRLPLLPLSPDVGQVGMLERLITVVLTGQPCQWVEEYRLDGTVGRYDQLYLQSGDGVLMLVQDITFHPLLPAERQQQLTLLQSIQAGNEPGQIRACLLALISGQLDLENSLRNKAHRRD